MDYLNSGSTKHCVRDPVHDLIEFGDDSFEQMLWKVVQTTSFQRLRRIRQLGFSELVYPGATHNRLEHSLGVFYNARRLNKIAQQQLGSSKFDQKRAEVSMAAALLHDVGHGPFSHSFETVGDRLKLGFGSHEDISNRIIRDSEVSEIMNDYSSGFANLVADLIAGKGAKDLYSSIVSSLFDADRLDYIIRDQHMTGSKNSIIDPEWLLSNIGIAEVPIINSSGKTKLVRHFVFSSRAKLALQTYILGLFNLYQSVYFHVSIRAAECVLVQLICRIIELIQGGLSDKIGLCDNHSIIRFAKEPKDLSKVLDLDDFVFWGAFPSLMRAEDLEIRRLATMLRNRNLPRAVDIREVVQGQIKGKNREDEINKIVFESIKKIEQYVNESGLSRNIWLDHIERNPYDIGDKGKSSKVPIFVKQSDEFIDLKDTSGAVNVAQIYQVDRVYFADEDSGSSAEVIRLIQNECKLVS